MNTVATNAGYAGDLSAREAWAIVASDATAQIIDVRTAAEWTYVGIPDLSEVGREALLVEWQTWPTGVINERFAETAGEALHQAGARADTPVLLLCRSGARSRAAAIALTKSGWTRAYNIVEGFEGVLDKEHHRSSQNGWKASGLPWRQS